MLCASAGRAQTAPQFITQPVSQTSAAGGIVTFSVSVSGSLPITFRWNKNGAAISGATAAAYTINGVTTNDQANYTVRVSNTYGAITSQVATLTVIVPPAITVQPKSYNTNVGATVTFSVGASGTAPLTYQWRKDGEDLLGATLNAYTLANVQPSDSGVYRVQVANPAGTATSTNAILNVGTAPAITAQPQSLTVGLGQSATFGVTATGTPLSYYWRKNAKLIPGATNDALRFASVVAADAATYTVQVSNFLRSVTSSGAVLTVLTPPSITAQPGNHTVGEGSNVTLTVTAAGTEPLHYCWRKEGVEIAGARSPSYTLNNAQMSDVGGYDVVVTNNWGAITSQVATLSVVRYPPEIVEQPQSQNVPVGGEAVFTVVAAGTTLSYQWAKDNADIPAATNSTYSLASVALADAGDFRVVITNFVGSVTSAVASLSVGYPPLILQQPESFTNNLGTSNVFSVVASGSEPLAYQWFKEGIAIANATNGQLPLLNLQSNQVGYYSVTITNPYGWTASSNALLSIPGVALPFQWLGLVAYYPFNGNANDASGNANNGVLNGPVEDLDRFGTTNAAYSFNGVNTSIVVTNMIAPVGREEFTLSAWLKLPPSAFVDNHRFIADAEVPEQWRVFLGTSATTQYLEFYTGGVRVGGAVITNWAANVWYHYVLARKKGEDDLDNVWWYWDGQLINTATVSVGSSGASSVAFGFGCCSAGWLGEMDDIRIYNRALSSNEVAQLYAYEADLPVITAQPLDQTAARGETASFSVTATASHPLTCQWFKDGTALSGFTNANLTLTNVQPNQTGFYSVVVSNAVAGVVSANAELTVSGCDFSLCHGLVGYYPFNGNANDESGNGNDGKPTNVAFAHIFPASENQVAVMTGRLDQWIEVPNSPSLNVTSLTLSVWFYNNRSDNSDVRFLCGKGYMQFELHFGTPAQPLSGLRFLPGNGAIIDTVGGTPAQQWTHLVCTGGPGSDGGKVYLNGNEVPVSISGNALAPIWSSSLPFEIGMRSQDHGWAHFDGRFDNFRIYNRALSSKEVAELYAYEADTPATTGQPQGTIVTQGGTPSFSVVATARNSLSYQWSKDGVPLADATNATLVIPGAQPSQAGLYAVAISSGFTGVVSEPAALVVMSSNGDGAPGFTADEFGFGLTGPPGLSFVVEVSTNLHYWLPLTTNAFAAGLFQFVDPDSGTDAMRFYRTRF
jgi:hypothetical protein